MSLNFHLWQLLHMISMLRIASQMNFAEDWKKTSENNLTYTFGVISAGRFKNWKIIKLKNLFDPELKIKLPTKYGLIGERRS